MVRVVVLMSISEVLMVAIFSGWLLLTLLRQFSGRWVDPITEWDQVGLIPVYRFFAPYPGRFDYHFLVRHRVDGAGDFSAWVEFGPSNLRGRWSAVFNPHKRVRKAYLDLATELARELQRQSDNSRSLNLSYPYLSLLLAAEDFLRVRFLVRGELASK